MASEIIQFPKVLRGELILQSPFGITVGTMSPTQRFSMCNEGPEKSCSRKKALYSSISLIYFI